MRLAAAWIRPPRTWVAPDALVRIGFQRSRLVMFNEAHNGFRRCTRTREVGRRLLSVAHAAGVRHLAMEALYPPEWAEYPNRERRPPKALGGYLAQPEMRDLIASALELGWTLHSYEAEPDSSWVPGREPSHDEINAREDEQAQRLTAAIEGLADDARLLVWCGNGHLCKRALDWWQPMAMRLRERSGIDPFAIDQTASVDLGAGPPAAQRWVEAFSNELKMRGGTAGFLAEDAPDGWPLPHPVDAYLLSTDNEIA